MPSRHIAGFALLLLVCCGEADTPMERQASVVLPDVVEVRLPEPRLEIMDIVEEMSEEVANRFVEFAPVLKRRALGEAAAWLTDDFAGHGPGALAVDEYETVVELPGNARRRQYDPAFAEVVGRDAWLESFGELLSVFSVLDSVVFKVKGAEFARGANAGGRVRLKVSAFGLSERRPTAITQWAYAEVKRMRGQWMLHRWQQLDLSIVDRDAPMFSDITVGADVAKQASIFGKDGNSLFYWNGAASHDVDGDGHWDLFVPTTGGCHLYRNTGAGSFEDIAGSWGLGGEHDGTGALFFDYDNDGDPDLFVAHVGWNRADGTPAGDTTRLYRNDGEGFTDVTAESGLDGRHISFSLTAGDFDGDGHTDLYVSSYNRMDAVYPESWYHAENGTPNALYRNLGDGTFENVAAAWGADDSRWTFAAAAADFDEDGDLDLALANDYGDNALLVNRGDGHFDDAAEMLGVLDPGNGMAALWGDVDNDSHLDLYISNMASTAGNRILGRLVPEDDTGTGGTLRKLAGGNSIFRQAKLGEFERVPPEWGGVGASWAWGTCLFDADLDGFQDVFCANGFLSGESAADT